MRRKTMPNIMKFVNTIHRCQTVFRSERLSDGICGAHHLFVFAICNHPGRSQEELSKQLFLNKSTVTRALSSLESSGYVRREVNPNDKRESLVYPTEKMTAILPRVREIAAEWNEILSAGISPEELSAFLSVIEKMEKNARTAILGAEGGEK